MLRRLLTTDAVPTTPLPPLQYRIFKKIVDSQTTAAPPAGSGSETDDVVWADMRRDAEMECRKASCWNEGIVWILT